MTVCNAVSGTDRRRLFWATQADACGSDPTCFANCGSSGLRLVPIKQAVCNYGCDATLGSCRHVDPVDITISTDGWLEGLIYNMLMTDGRKEDTACGYIPGGQGGHWSESFTSGQVGTLVRFIPTAGSIREGLNLVVAYAKATLERLVARGVAVSVDVSGKYIGNGTMSLDITVYGVGSVGVARVGMTAERTATSWIWGRRNGL